MSEGEVCFQSVFARSSIRNPGTFYITDKTYDYDWTSPANNNLWRDEAKTLFDPCPAGWRVPQSGEGDRSPWSAFSLDNGTWQGSGETTGFRFTLSSDSPAVWYGACGARSWDWGFFSHLGSTAFCWSTSKTTTSIVYIFQFSPTKIQPTNGSGNHRSYGFSVRCIRE